MLKLPTHYDIKHELLTQDNYATQYPLYCVFEIMEMNAEEGWGDDWYYICGGNKIGKTYEEVKQFMDDNEYDFPEGINDRDSFEKNFLDWTQGYYYPDKKCEYNLDIKHVYRIEKFVTACFTKRAAEEYIEANKHRMNEPHLHIESLYRNYEMIEVREGLMK